MCLFPFYRDVTQLPLIAAFVYLVEHVGGDCAALLPLVAHNKKPLVADCAVSRPMNISRQALELHRQIMAQQRVPTASLPVGKLFGIGDAPIAPPGRIGMMSAAGTVVAEFGG